MRWISELPFARGVLLPDAPGRSHSVEQHPAFAVAGVVTDIDDALHPEGLVAPRPSSAPAPAHCRSGTAAAGAAARWRLDSRDVRDETATEEAAHSDTWPAVLTTVLMVLSTTAVKLYAARSATYMTIRCNGGMVTHPRPVLVLVHDAHRIAVGVDDHGPVELVVLHPVRAPLPHPAIPVALLGAQIARSSQSRWSSRNLALVLPQLAALLLEAVALIGDADQRRQLRAVPRPWPVPDSPRRVWRCWRAGHPRPGRRAASGFNVSITLAAFSTCGSSAADVSVADVSVSRTASVLRGFGLRQGSAARRISVASVDVRGPPAAGRSARLRLTLDAALRSSGWWSSALLLDGLAKSGRVAVVDGAGSARPRRRRGRGGGHLRAGALGGRSSVALLDRRARVLVGRGLAQVRGDGLAPPRAASTGRLGHDLVSVCTGAPEV